MFCGHLPCCFHVLFHPLSLLSACAGGRLLLFAASRVFVSHPHSWCVTLRFSGFGEDVWLDAIRDSNHVLTARNHKIASVGLVCCCLNFFPSRCIMCPVFFAFEFFVVRLCIFVCPTHLWWYVPSNTHTHAQIRHTQGVQSTCESRFFCVCLSGLLRLFVCRCFSLSALWLSRAVCISCDTPTEHSFWHTAGAKELREQVGVHV